MKRDLAACTAREFDLIVVGGGIFGACAAWEAASRGLSVVLVEEGDFSHATSGSHFRMIHGGIRYLQHGDLFRVRESSHERSALLRIAPHLAQPLPIVVPTYGHGMKGKEILRAGLLAYDLLTFDRNRGIPDPQRHIPAGRTVSRRELLELFPDVNERGLTGAAIFHDGQMYNPARLALAFIKSAVRAGAEAANYVEVTGFQQDGGRVVGVQARDVLGGAGLEIRGRMVLNTAGPWANVLLEKSLGAGLAKPPVFSRDACFIVRRKPSSPYALTILGRTSDPDALLSRGRRHLFLVPWQDVTLVGVWHIVHQGQPGDFTVTAEELQEWIDEFNESYPALDLSLNDVSRWMAGLVLFGDKQEGGENLSYGKRSQIIDHRQEHGIEGLVTLLGVRATTARGMAEKAMDMVVRKLGKRAAPSRTAFTPLHGGEIESFEACLQQAIRQRPAAVSAGSVEHIAHNHGAAYPEVFQYVKADECWAEPVGASPFIKAEILHAVRAEMAQKLSDVVFRRTDLGSGGHPGEAALRASAEIMAQELGWDRSRVEAELDEAARSYPAF